MPLDLDVPVGVDGLRDRRVPELSLHPPNVSARIEQPGRVAMPGRMILPIRKLGAIQLGLPDQLVKVGIPNSVPPPRDVGNTSCLCSDD